MITILLISYILFLMIYVAVNGYILHRAWEMKIEGDKTALGIIVFTSVVAVIFITSLILLLLILGFGGLS